MRVFHVITGLGDGGAEGVLYRLCAASPEHRHVVVSLTDAGKHGPRLRAIGIPVHTLDQRRGRISLPALRRLHRLLRAERPDVVQTWMYHGDLVGGLVARIAGHRNVCWNVRNSDLSREKTSWSTIQTMRACAWLSRWVPRRIACCARRAAELHATLGYDRRKFVIIPNGIELTRFRPDPEAGRRWRDDRGQLGATRPLLGMVARHDPQKDHANLIEALRRLRAAGHDVDCVLAGTGLTDENGPLKEALAAAGLADRVHLVGPSDDVPALMNALDVHVFSSRYGEAFPNVVAEAMACGTPCVVTDVGDAAEVVAETGWSAPPADPQALADALAAALEARADADAWGARREAARRRVVDHYAMEGMVAAYAQLWAEFAGDPTAA